MHLEDAAAFIPYGCMVDEFQHIVYETPELTPQERRREWSRLEKIYMPHLDYEEDPFFSKGGFWQKQQRSPHPEKNTAPEPFVPEIQGSSHI